MKNIIQIYALSRISADHRTKHTQLNVFSQQEWKMDFVFFLFPKKSEMATLAVGSQQPLCSQYKAEEKFRNLKIL